MPHFGLMDPGKMSAEEAALMRAKLHIRAGRRRLRQGKIAAGIVTLYDALTYAIQWYLSDPGHRENLDIHEGERVTNEDDAFAILARSGVFGEGFDPAPFDDFLSKALEDDKCSMPGYDYSWFLEAVEKAMTRLGVMPFDESALPPEDPKTY
ncbi:MAG: hypothetical protein P8Y85_02115 [Nitrospirota bacterium]|jgi:hypothetical protein